MTDPIQRREAARRFEALADTEFFKALSEPIRVRILTALMETGRTDISSLAQRFPQDRSVISRHLALLESCGMVRSVQEGRHRFYEVDGPNIVQNLETLTNECRVMVRLCGC